MTSHSTQRAIEEQLGRMMPESDPDNSTAAGKTKFARLLQDFRINSRQSQRARAREPERFVSERLCGREGCRRNRDCGRKAEISRKRVVEPSGQAIRLVAAGKRAQRLVG